MAAILSLVIVLSSSALPLNTLSGTVRSASGVLSHLIYLVRGYTSSPLVRGKYNGWQYVAATIENKPVMMLIDTGAGPNTLDPGWAIINAPRLFGRKPTADISPITFRVNRPIYPKVFVGGIGLPFFEFHYNPDRFPEATRRDGLKSIQGILGIPFLRYYSAVIDNGTDTLYLLDPARREAGLQGDWVATEVEADGRRKPVTAKSNTRLSVRGVDAVYSSGGVDLVFTPVLDLSKSPRQMDMVNAKGETLLAIYKLDGDTLTIAAELFENGRSSPNRPPQFKAADGDAHSVVTFRRVKPKP